MHDRPSPSRTEKIGNIHVQRNPYPLLTPCEQVQALPHTRSFFGTIWRLAFVPDCNLQSGYECWAPGNPHPPPPILPYIEATGYRGITELAIWRSLERQQQVNHTQRPPARDAKKPSP